MIRLVYLSLLNALPNQKNIVINKGSRSGFQAKRPQQFMILFFGFGMSLFCTACSTPLHVSESSGLASTAHKYSAGSPKSTASSHISSSSPTACSNIDSSFDQQSARVDCGAPHPVCEHYGLEITKTLRLAHLVHEVLIRNPDLAATKERIQAAEFFQKRVQVWEDPEFIVMRHDQPFGSTSDSPFKPKMRYSVVQEIPFPGKLSLKGKIEGQQVAFLQSENIATKKDLVLESKKLFFQLYYYDTALKINEFNRNIISEFVKTTFALYRSGEDSFSEAVKAQVELQRLDDEKLKLISMKDRLLSLINTILNREAYESLGTPEACFSSELSLDYKALEGMSSQYNPEIKGIDSRIGEQKFRKDLAKREYFPNFIVGSRFDHILGSSDTAWGVSIGINVPIWIPWKQRRDVQKAGALMRAYEDDLQGLKSTIRGRIRKILSEVHALDERIILLESGILPKTLESLESGKAEYQAGKGDFLTLLDTIRQYYQYQLEFEQARIEREIALAELERTVGVNLGDMNEENN